MPEPVNNLKIRLLSVGNPLIVTPVPLQMEGPLSPESLRINFKVLVRIIRPESRIAVTVSMGYHFESTALFEGGVTTEFEVVDLASLITANEGEDEFRLENDFLPMLINIAFSTARGYFAHELKDSVLAP